MVNLLFFGYIACRPIHRPKNQASIPPNQQIGTVDAREFILIAYTEQYKQNPSASMQAFSNAQEADPDSAVIFLLWGDSAWEQGLRETAVAAWKEYRQRIKTSDTEKLALISERLERS